MTYCVFHIQYSQYSRHIIAAHAADEQVPVESRAGHMVRRAGLPAEIEPTIAGRAIWDEAKAVIVDLAEGMAIQKQ